jgi:hypothetical protein
MLLGKAAKLLKYHKYTELSEDMEVAIESFPVRDSCGVNFYFRAHSSVPVSGPGSPDDIYLKSRDYQVVSDQALLDALHSAEIEADRLGFEIRSVTIVPFFATETLLLKERTSQVIEGTIMGESVIVGVPEASR